MGSVMKVAIGIIGIMIAFIMFPLVLSGADDIQTDEVDQTFVNVTTAVATTTADLSLTRPLYKDNIGYVSAVASGSAADTPVADSYNGTTDVLTVSGLIAAGSRTLVVDYENDATADFTGLGDMVEIGPLIIFIGILVGALASLWGATQDIRGRFSA